MSERKCLRCKEKRMALLGNATISVTSERSSAELGSSETRDFLFQIYVCPNCGYVELSK